MDSALMGEFIRSYHDGLNESLSTESSRREGLQK